VIDNQQVLLCHIINPQNCIARQQKHVHHISFKFYLTHQVEGNRIVMVANITSKQNEIVHDTTAH